MGEIFEVREIKRPGGSRSEVKAAVGAATLWTTQVASFVVGTRSSDLSDGDGGLNWNVFSGY